MSRAAMLMLVSALLWLSPASRAAELPPPCHTAPGCPPIWCVDDYCPKPYPHYFCGPSKVCCDDYCIKPTPCIVCPQACACPDDYDCKPLPCLNFFLNTRWLKCPPTGCQPCK